MKFSWLKKNYSVGIQLNDADIRIVQLDYQSKKTKLINQSFKPDDAEQWEQWQTILAELVKNHALEHLPTGVSLPLNLTHMHHLEIPTGIDEVSIEATIKTYLKHTFKSAVSDWCIDFAVLQKPDDQYADVYFVAAKATEVDRYYNCLTSCGLQVKTIDVETHALRRALINLESGKSDVTQAVIWVQGQVGLLMIYDHSKIYYQQDFLWQDINQLVGQLKTKLQIYLALKIKPIERLLLLTPSNFLVKIQTFLTEAYQVPIIHCESLTQLNPDHPSKTASPDDQLPYLIAYGMALHNMTC